MNKQPDKADVTIHEICCAFMLVCVWLVQKLVCKINKMCEQTGEKHFPYKLNSTATEAECGTIREEDIYRIREASTRCRLYNRTVVTAPADCVTRNEISV